VTVVFLHAFPVDERMWAPQLEALAARRTYAPRLYGRGRSLAAWAAGILGEVEGELVAVGASMGGYCALELARQAPDRVRGLVLAGSRAAADSPERRRFRDELIEHLRAYGVPPEMPAAAGAEELAAATEALRDRADASDVLASFAGPVLVCVGDRDDVLSVEEARSVAAIAPDGRLEVFAGAGHLPSVEQPDSFNGVLSDFLAPWT